MAFRSDESAENGYKEAEAYLTRHIDPSERERSKRALRALSGDIGPVVNCYPTWHPILSGQKNDRYSLTTPNDRCGYRGLDHTRFFARGFITCPYGDGQDVIDSVDQLPHHGDASIRAERLDVKLYADNATPILVRCDWEHSLENDGMVPLKVALPLILEHELPARRWAEVGETWETMRPYFLGQPHGNRSSHFVSQETGTVIKKVWNELINTGMFGPIKV
jgi:hypothetical protein